MSDGQMIFSPAVVKPVFAGVMAGFLDRTILKTSDLNSNMMFGVSVGAGTFLGDIAGEYASRAVPDGQNMYIFSGKTLLQRALEIGVASPTSYAMNRYIFSQQNDYSNMDMARRVGVIAVSQIMGEYFADYMIGKPLGYLA